MSLYERLGVAKGADAQDIRKAYLRLSKTAHPDKGGSEEEFKKISQAYEILSDDSKRSFYDQTGQIPGEEGAPPDVAGHGMPFPFDLGGMFGGMFGGGGIHFGMGGGGGAQQRRPRRPKAPPKIHEIGLTLNDFFYGKNIQIKFDRQTFCDACKGEGAEEFETCKRCSGAGFQEQRIMIGPGMMASSRSPCGGCSGEGKQPKKACQRCSGAKFRSQEKILTAKIEPGMKPGDILQFAKACSDSHEFEEPGDVHIVLREADERGGFQRTGDDLRIVVNVPFFDALLGGSATIHNHPAHPQGLKVAIPVGSMRGDVLTVGGEGMPRRGAEASQRGTLYITLAVDVSEKDRRVLEANKNSIGACWMSV